MIKKDGIRHPTVTEHGIYGFYDEFRFLSNFHPVEIQFGNYIFPSSEHAYVSAKTHNEAIKEHISKIIKPQHVKKYGDTVVLYPGWEVDKLAVMFDILVRKFSNKDLRESLLQTENLYLEETNDWNDTFWGVCNGVGQNNLGKILMRIRDLIKCGYLN